MYVLALSSILDVAFLSSRRSHTASNFTDFTLKSARPLIYCFNPAEHYPQMRPYDFSMFLLKFILRWTNCFTSSLYKSTSTSSTFGSVEGSDFIGLFRVWKLAVGSLKSLYMHWISPPSFRFDITYVLNFSMKTWNCTFLSNFSDLRANKTPISSHWPLYKKELLVICHVCRLLWVFGLPEVVPGVGD